MAEQKKSRLETILKIGLGTILGAGTMLFSGAYERIREPTKKESQEIPILINQSNYDSDNKQYTIIMGTRIYEGENPIHPPTEIYLRDNKNKTYQNLTDLIKQQAPDTGLYFDKPEWFNNSFAICQKEAGKAKGGLWIFELEEKKLKKITDSPSSIRKKEDGRLHYVSLEENMQRWYVYDSKTGKIIQEEPVIEKETKREKLKGYY